MPTATRRPVLPGRRTTPAPIEPPSRSIHRPGWILPALFLGFPLWWILGVAHVAGIAFGAVAAVHLALRQRLRAPPGFGLWVLFLVWVVASSVMLGWPPRSPVSFVFRALSYTAAGLLLLYVFNLDQHRVPAAWIADVLARFWIVLIGFGLAALILPSRGIMSVLELVLPPRLLADPFLFEIVHPNLAQHQTFLGYPVPRPAAPFVYTNNWGSAVALLTPFFVIRYVLSSVPRRRNLGRILAGIAIVPVVFSLNRGLWLSLAVGLLYAGLRYARRGRLFAAQAIVLAFVGIGLVAYLSPLQGLVSDRLDVGHSNDSRTTLYAEVAERVQASPLFGYGAPENVEIPGRRLPPVGTQGQFWMVLFSHGIVGAGLFVGWFLSTFRRTLGGDDPITFWANVTLLIAIVQLPFYGMLPTQLLIIVTAAALALRALDRTAPLRWEVPR